MAMLKVKLEVDISAVERAVEELAGNFLKCIQAGHTQAAQEIFDGDFHPSWIDQEQTDKIDPDTGEKILITKLVPSPVFTQKLAALRKLADSAEA